MNYAEKQIHELKNLVTRYRRIPQQAHHDFIAFYENFYGLIHQLDFDEMVEINFTYLKSLYQLEFLDLFYKQCDKFIFDLLNHDEFKPRHQKIYEEIIFLKSCALKDELKTKDSMNILASLGKLNKTEKKFLKTYETGLYQEEMILAKPLIAMTILLILATLVLTASQLFIIQHFYQNLVSGIELARNICFGMAISLFVFIQGRAYYRLKRKVRSIVK